VGGSREVIEGELIVVTYSSKVSQIVKAEVEMSQQKKMRPIPTGRIAK
jgi:phosphopentomutase